jgi:hypothetical protein
MQNNIPQEESRYREKMTRIGANSKPMGIMSIKWEPVILKRTGLVYTRLNSVTSQKAKYLLNHHCANLQILHGKGWLS